MKTGLVGYGKMGRGIFSLFSGAAMDVTVLVRSPEKAERNNTQLQNRLRRAARSGVMDEAAAAERSAALRFSCAIEDLRDCDLVMESVPEDFPVKVDVLKQIEGVVSDRCVLTTNTSVLSVARLAEQLRLPARFCGLHFFHPLQLSSIAEIIRWPGVAPSSVSFLEDACRLIQRRPLVVNDVPGSALNSALVTYYVEGLYLLEQGAATPLAIDRMAGRLCRVGPCESVDVIGIGFFRDAFERTKPVRPPGLDQPLLLDRLLAQGRLGKEHGVGLCDYRDGRLGDEAPGFYAVPEQQHSKPAAALTEAEIVHRILYALFCGILFTVKKGWGDIETLDAGVKDILGMEVGLLERMRGLGPDKLRAGLAELGECVGRRFDPELADYLTV